MHRYFAVFYAKKTWQKVLAKYGVTAAVVNEHTYCARCFFGSGRMMLGPDRRAGSRDTVCAAPSRRRPSPPARHCPDPGRRGPPRAGAPPAERRPSLGRYLASRPPERVFLGLRHFIGDELMYASFARQNADEGRFFIT